MFRKIISVAIVVPLFIILCGGNAQADKHVQTRNTVPGYYYSLNKKISLHKWNKWLGEINQSPLYMKQGWSVYFIDLLLHNDAAGIDGDETSAGKHTIHTVAGRAATILEYAYGFNLPPVSKNMSPGELAEVHDVAVRQDDVYKATIKTITEEYNLAKDVAVLRNKYHARLNVGTENETHNVLKCYDGRVFHNMLCEYMPIGRRFSDLEEQIIGKRAAAWNPDVDGRQNSHAVTGELFYIVIDESGFMGRAYAFYVEDGIIRCITTLPLD
jgi:hypothetical protein